VARLALQAEQVLGGAADVEWAIAGGKVWLLQARPLIQGIGTEASAEAQTTLGPSGPTPAFPFVWPDPEAAGIHWRQKADDARVFEVLPPFELDARRTNNRSMRRATTLNGAAEQDACFEVNGYLYSGKRPAPGTAESRAQLAQAALRATRALHAQGDTFFEKVIIPTALEAIARLGIDPDTLSTPALADHFQQVLDWYEEAWVLHMSMDPWDEASPVGRASAIYSEITGDENRWAIFSPFGHIPQKGHEMVDGLVALAGIVKASPALLRAFEAGEPEQVLAELDALEGGEAFRARLDVVLDEHGLQSGASQGIMRSQVMPGWREQPALVIALVQRYLALDLEPLIEARRRGTAHYTADVAALHDKVAASATPEQLRDFEFWWDAARRQVVCAVDHNAYLDGPMNAMLHWALMACGRRLAAAGALDDPGDAWWLRAHQVEAAVRSLETQPVPDWRALVAGQKAQAEWQRSLTPPPYLGAPPEPEEPAAPDDEEELPANLLVKGWPASPGVVTGRVRRIDPHDMVPDVQPGDIFVAGDCGVLWASLLPIAAAVVLDGSYPGEHPMRVCTEFGIPGIVQAKVATQLLHEGQRVIVDGNRGWVLASY
jgi:rifampicin phosphotransferase